MLFIDNKQKEFFLKKVAELGIENDVERLALVYALSLTSNCRARFSHCYDTKERCVRADVLKCGWVTSADSKAIRLGFHLFTWGTPTAFSITDNEKREEEIRRYLPIELFCCSLAPYFVEAIKIRYPEYFGE